MRDCPMINKINDAEAGVALKEDQERMLHERRKSADAYTDPVLRYNQAEYRRLARKLLEIGM